MDWSAPGIGRALFFMSFVAILCFVILLLHELGLISLAIYYIRHRRKEETPRVPKSKLNDDVQAEKDKVNGMNSQELMSTNLVVRNLTKFYGDLIAVKELCIAIDMQVLFFIEKNFFP